LLRVAIVLSVLAAIGGAGYYFVKGFREARELPTFSGIRPTYGTVSLALDGVSQGEVTDMTLTTGGDGAVIHMTSSAQSSVPSIELITDGSTVFVRAPDTPDWVHDNYRDIEAFRGVQAMARVAIFDDYIPSAARPFVELRSKKKSDLNGRALTRYDLRIDERAFKRESPFAYQTWSEMYGSDESGPGASRLVLSVDDTGVVWQMESWSDVVEDHSTLTLVAYSIDPFVPPYPTTYIDNTNGGVLVGPEIAAPERGSVNCDVEFRTLETAVEAFTLDTGAVPASEAELVPVYLLVELSGADFVDGMVVPAPGVCA
jgi:hypothetical protein